MDQHVQQTHGDDQEDERAGDVGPLTGPVSLQGQREHGEGVEQPEEGPEDVGPVVEVGEEAEEEEGEEEGEEGQEHVAGPGVAGQRLQHLGQEAPQHTALRTQRARLGSGAHRDKVRLTWAFLNNDIMSIKDIRYIILKGVKSPNNFEGGKKHLGCLCMVCLCLYIYVCVCVCVCVCAHQPRYSYSYIYVHGFIFFWATAFIPCTNLFHFGPKNYTIDHILMPVTYLQSLQRPPATGPGR